MKNFVQTGTIVLLTILVMSCSSNKLNKQESQLSNTQNKLLEKIDSLEQELSKYTRTFEPGKVYSRCSVHPQFELTQSDDQYRIYTGSDTTQVGLSKITIESKPAYLTWEKVNSSELCEAYGAADDFDCENWHLKEYSPIYKTIYVVSDTNKINEFELSYIEIMKEVKKTSLTNVREFICPEIYGQYVIIKIQKALREKGYDLEGAKPNVLDEVTKTAILNYQKANGLSIGTLNDEILKSLNIK